MHNNPIIEIADLRNRFGDQWVLDGVNITINHGEIVAIVGGSGSGKTTLLNCILMLRKPTSGKVILFGEDIHELSSSEQQRIRRRWGVSFQHSALFSSLTVIENIAYPIHEFTQLSTYWCKHLAFLKLYLVGLPIEAANKFPAELSGGMQKRAAVARALALDPELLFLDEPTSGLDPKSAGAFDNLIVHLRDMLDLTVVMVTHDLDTLWDATDRVAFLGDGKLLAIAPMHDLVHNSHPLIQDFFSGSRGQRRNAHIQVE